MIFSQYELRASEVHEGDLIVKHDLLLGPNSKIYGSIKCHGNLRLSPGAQVFGNMVGQKNIEFLGENWVTGTVLGNQKIVIGNAVLIGSESRQVTCSAREIYLRGAFQVHGVLRAWRAGVILGKA